MYVSLIYESRRFGLAFFGKLCFEKLIDIKFIKAQSVQSVIAAPAAAPKAADNGAVVAAIAAAIVAMGGGEIVSIRPAARSGWTSASRLAGVSGTQQF